MSDESDDIGPSCPHHQEGTVDHHPSNCPLSPQQPPPTSDPTPKETSAPSRRGGKSRGQGARRGTATRARSATGVAKSKRGAASSNACAGRKRASRVQTCSRKTRTAKGLQFEDDLSQENVLQSLHDKSLSDEGGTNECQHSLRSRNIRPKRFVESSSDEDETGPSVFVSRKGALKRTKMLRTDYKESDMSHSKPEEQDKLRDTSSQIHQLSPPHRKTFSFGQKPSHSVTSGSQQLVDELFGDGPATSQPPENAKTGSRASGCLVGDLELERSEEERTGFSVKMASVGNGTEASGSRNQTGEHSTIDIDQELFGF